MGEKKKNKLVISVCTKARKEVENQVFVGQLHFYNSHFFIDFTFDLFLLIEKMGMGEIKPKRHMNQQMWCLIIETCDSKYNMVFLTNDILAFFKI